MMITILYLWKICNSDDCLQNDKYHTVNEKAK